MFLKSLLTFVKLLLTLNEFNTCYIIDVCRDISLNLETQYLSHSETNSALFVNNRERKRVKYYLERKLILNPKL